MSVQVNYQARCPRCGASVPVDQIAEHETACKARAERTARMERRARRARRAERARRSRSSD